MKKVIIFILSIIFIIVLFLYYAMKLQAPYNILGAAQNEIDRTNFPYLCPNSNNGIWWVGGYVDPNSKLVYYQYIVEYNNDATNKSILSNLKNNPSIFYASVCNMKFPRQIIDETNGIVASWRTEYNPYSVTIHVTKDICKKY